MYYPVHHQNDLEGGVYHSPYHHQHANHHQKISHYPCYSRSTWTAYPDKMPPAQTPPANQPNGDTPGPCPHQQKTNHDHDHPGQRAKLAIYPQVPMYGYTYVLLPADHPSRDNHRKDDHQSTPEEDHKPPTRHSHPTFAHAQNHHHCHLHHTTPPQNRVHVGNNGFCRNHEDMNAPQPQSRSYPHFTDQTKNGNSENPHTCQYHQNQHHTPPKPTMGWIWGPPLPGFVVGPRMNAPKYKRG